MKLLILTVFASIGLAQTATPTKTDCISDVCLGDDLGKIIALKITWLDERSQLQPRTPQTGRSIAKGYEPVMNPQDLREVEKDFRGLTDSEYRLLATSVGVGGVPDEAVEIFVPQTVHIVLLNTTLPILKKTITCSAVPLHGIFKSENGHLTSVLLMSDSGKFTVVKLARQWVLNPPTNANSAQQNQVVNEQLNALYKQIRETYSGTWIQDRYYVPPVSASVRSGDSVAYFNWSDMSHPILTLYAAAFQKLESQGGVYPRGDWRNVAGTYEQTLAKSPGCAVKAPAIKIN